MAQEPTTTRDVSEQRRYVPFGIHEWFRSQIGTLLVVGGLFASWLIYSTFFNPRGDIYFPSVGYTIQQTLEFSDLVIAGVQTTFVSILFGYVLSLIAGVTIGVILAESFVVRQMSLPSIVFSYSLPHAILAPVFILWFGNGILGIGIFAAWFGFFSVMINTITGFNSVEREFHYLADVVGATHWQKIQKIKVWAALPHVASGAKIALQQTIIGVIIGEFIATGSGLGYLIVSASALNRLGLLFGVLIIIMVFAITMYKLVSLVIEFITPGETVEVS